MTTNLNADTCALLKEVAAVLVQNGLRPDLQEGLHLACAIEKNIAKMSAGDKQKAVEWEKFQVWHTATYPASPITGHDASLRWGSWLARSQVNDAGAQLSAELAGNIKKLLDLSGLQRYDGHCGEGGGIWQDDCGDYIDIDDVRDRHKLIIAALDAKCV